MIALVGGSPSTGSSALVRALDRHSLVAAGPETSLFARMSLMTHWQRDRDLIIGKHLRKLYDHGWHRYRGVTLTDDYYPWNKQELGLWIAESKTFGDFVMRLEASILTSQGAQYWIEKTPSNAYSYGWMNRYMPHVKTILMIRHPYDSIASMMARGYNVVYATAAYLLHTSAGYIDEHQLVIKYEDFVSRPDDVLSMLCSHLSLDYEQSMLTPDVDQVQMEGWLQSESAPITTASVGRFSRLADATKQDIIDCVASLKVNDQFRLSEMRWSFSQITELSDHFGYELAPGTPGDRQSKYTFVCWKEAIIRTYKGYPTHLWNFPLSY